MVLRSFFASLTGFMVGLLCLGFEMLLLFLLNDTRFEPPHHISFTVYPALFGVASIGGGLLMLFTWLCVVFPIDLALLKGRISFKGTLIACALVGLVSGAFFTHSLIPDDFLLLGVVSVYWAIAASVTVISLKLLQRGWHKS